MNVLIDTQCWLWWFAEEERLNESARRLIGTGEGALYFSAASSWEITIKCAIGKLKLPEAPEVYVLGRLASQGMMGMPIEHVHALRVASLPDHHRDPFDRLLVAQAQIEGLSVLTADPLIAAYDVEAIWAGQGPPRW
jgi:PIN domain nuclease of toxin-antitoxin system